MRLRIDPTAPSGVSPVVSESITTISSSGGTGTSVHSELTNLDYVSSGHTGFQPAGTYLTDISGQDLSTADNTTSAFITADDIPTIPSDISELTDTTGIIPTSVDDLAPSQTGNSGKFLGTDGTNATWTAIPGGGDMLASVYDPAGGAEQVAFASDLGTAAAADTGDFAPALGDDDNYVTDAEKAALHPAVTITGEDYLTMTSQAITMNAIDLDNLSATGTPSISNYLRGDNTWAEVVVGSGGYASNVYPTNIDSDVSGYKKLAFIPDAGETVKSVVVKNNEVLSTNYIYDADIGITEIPSGLWIFNFRSKVSLAVGITTARFVAFTRTSGGSETELFSHSSNEINNTDYADIRTETAQPPFSCNATDRLGLRVYYATTSNADITVNTAIGTVNASYINAPLQIRHSQLRVPNEDPEVQHMTSSEKTKLGALTQYTDEMAQDAVGGMVNTTLTYTDGTPELKVTNPVTPAAVGFTISAGTTSKTLTVPLDASVSGTNTGDQDLSSLMPKSGGTFTNDITMDNGKSVAFENAAGNSTLYLYNNGGTGANILETGANFVSANIASGASVSGSNTGDQTGGTPSLTLGTANTAGDATTFIRTNDTILAFDATVPSTQAFGDVAATGSATVAARRDHKHAMPAAPTNATTVTVADESSDTTCFPLFSTAATGDLGPKSNTNFTYNSNAARLTSPNISVDNISEKTTNNGVVIDSMPIKDGLVVGGAGTGVANSSLSTTAGDIGGAWLAWTPTLSGRFTDAKWDKSCYYTKIGKTIHFRVYLKANTTTPMAGGSADAIFTLPVNSVSIAAQVPTIGVSGILDSGTARYTGCVEYNSTTTARIRFTDTAGATGGDTQITSTVPFTWTTNDELFCSGTYEAA